MNTGTFFQIVAELGLPIVATIGMGMFVLNKLPSNISISSDVFLKTFLMQ